MAALGALAEHLAARRALPAATRAAAKLHLIDTVGAWIATATTREGRALAALRETMRKDGAAADIATDIMVSCALVRMSEIDDIHTASMITPGSIVIPAALTIAAAQPDARADDVCEAIAAGYEAMIRLGGAIDGPAILYRGIWPSYFCAGFGVAAVAARLFKLDAAQTAHALALALTLAPPGVGHHNAPTGSRWLAAGMSARNGLLAAEAAHAGFSSDTGILDGPYLSNVYAIKPDAAAITDAVGERVPLDEVSFKPWCAARQTMAATQALKEIVEGGVDADAIEAVDVAVPPQFLRMIDHGINDNDRVSRLTSVQYQMALAVLAPGEAFHVGQTRPVVPGVREFMDRISVRADEELGRAYPKLWPARVGVTAGGARHERNVTHVPGDPARPFDAKTVAEKFQRFVDRRIGEDPARQLLEHLSAFCDGARTPVQALAAIERARTLAAKG